jgi:hypothetical protein
MSDDRQREFGPVLFGDAVVIKAFIMQPWGWPEFPKIPGSDCCTHIDIPTGTEAVVIRGTDDDGSVTVDYVLGDTLYRTVVERQYIRRRVILGADWDVYVRREHNLAWERYFGPKVRLTKEQADGMCAEAERTLKFLFPNVIAKAARF